MKKYCRWLKLDSMPGRVKIALACASMLALAAVQMAFIFPAISVDCNGYGCRAGLNVRVDNSVRCDAYASVRAPAGYSGPGFREGVGCDGYRR